MFEVEQWPRTPSPHPSPPSKSDVSDLDQLCMAELGNTRVRRGEGVACGSLVAKCNSPARRGEGMGNGRLVAERILEPLSIMAAR
jgi:hypothetical protein